MSETGLDGAKDIFFSHKNIVRKNILRIIQIQFVNGIQNYTYVGIYTQEQYKNNFYL